jgi:hypothetical protein
LNFGLDLKDEILYNLIVENKNFNGGSIMTREQIEKEERRRKYLGMLYAQQQALANKLPFKTAEEELIEKIGEGILQSQLTNGELLRLQKLMEYPRNSSLRPKFMSKFTPVGVLIVPYPKPSR